MSFWSAIIQAIVQGLSEFLPISSSGHLSLVQHFTGSSGESALLYSAILHLGTLVAVFVVFWKQIFELILEAFKMIKDIFTGKFSFKNPTGARRVIFMLVVSTAILVPFLLIKDYLTAVSEDDSILIEGLCFIYTACLLFIADRTQTRGKTAEDMNYKDAVRVGFFQSIALLPGVSRSGSTISAGLLSGLTREAAVSYSFILGIPAILGGCLIEVKDGIEEGVTFNPLYLLLGFIVSAIVGVLSIKLVKYISKGDKFKIFWIYTGVLGVATITVAVIEIILGHPITFNV